MTGIWVSHWAGRYLEAVLWSKFVAKKSVKYLEVSLKVYTFAPVKQKGHGRVAQLNRVADYGSAGYRFESCRGHEKHLPFEDAFFCCLLLHKYIEGFRDQRKNLRDSLIKHKF